MVGLEGTFPFVAFTDAYVVVSPSNIEFAEELHALEVFDTLGKIGERGDVLLGYCIEWTVVDDVVLLLAVFLGHHKGAEAIGGVRRHDVAILQVFVEEFVLYGLICK